MKKKNKIRIPRFFKGKQYDIMGEFAQDKYKNYPNIDTIEKYTHIGSQRNNVPEEQYNKALEDLNNDTEQLLSRINNTVKKGNAQKDNVTTNRTKRKPVIEIEQPYIDNKQTDIQRVMNDKNMGDGSDIVKKGNMLYRTIDNDGNPRYYNREGYELTPIMTPNDQIRLLQGELDPISLTYRDAFGNIYSHHKQQELPTQQEFNDTQSRLKPSGDDDYYQYFGANPLENAKSNISREWNDLRHGRGLTHSLLSSFAPMSGYATGTLVLNDLTSNNGIAKTINLINDNIDKNAPINAYGAALTSGVGDALQIGILPFAYNKAFRAIGNKRLPGDAAFRRGWYNQTPLDMIVDQNGNISSSGVNRTLRNIAWREGLGESQNHVRYKNVDKMTYNPSAYTPEGEKYIGTTKATSGYETENQSTFRHMANAAKTAQELPVASGSTRQNQVASALFHDMGERYDRADHAKLGAKIIDKYIADFDPEIYHNVKNHMDNVLFNTPSVQALHAADVISGGNSSEIMRKNNTLWYIPEGDVSQYTNLGKNNLSNSEEIRRANVFFKEVGLETIPENATVEQARSIFEKNMSRYRTVARGVNINKPKMSWVKDWKNVDYDTKKQRIKDTKRYVQGVIQTALNGQVPTEENVAKTLVERTPLVKSPMNTRGETAAKENFGQSDLSTVYTSNSEEVASHYASGEGTAYPMSVEIKIPKKGNGTFSDELLSNNFQVSSVNSTKRGTDFDRTGRTNLFSNYEVPYMVRTGRTLRTDANAFLQSEQGSSFLKEQQELIHDMEQRLKSNNLKDNQIDYLNRTISQLKNPWSAAGTKESYTANDFWSRVYDAIMKKHEVRPQGMTIEGKTNPTFVTTEGVKRPSATLFDENQHFIYVGKNNQKFTQPNKTKKLNEKTSSKRNVSHKGRRSENLTPNM